MLCSICSPLFRNPSTREKRQHHPTRASLIEAARSGCYICEPLLNGIASERGVPEDRRQRVSCSFFGNFESKYWYIEIDTDICVNGRQRIHTYYCKMTILLNHQTPDDLMRRSKTGFSTTAAAEQARMWIKTCLERHRLCQKNTQPKSYPTRLLQIEGSSIRLISSAETTPNGPYGALSYCWGPNPTFLRLTSSNKSLLEQGVPLNDLPVAFREAVDVLRHLGIYYLWIDALCIIQSGPNSIDDWRSESARMHEVYSNSILNISLSRAKQPEDSCLAGWTPKGTTNGFPVEADLESISLGKRPCLLESLGSEQQLLHAQPLEHRAWAFQERLLSPRVLSFGLGEMFWSCAELFYASECLPAGNPDFLHGAERRIRNPEIPETALQYSTGESLWYYAVSEYTKRRLTFPESDKLVAFSAIAKRIATLEKHVYVAGHFWKLLPVSLQWRVPRGQTTRRICNGTSGIRSNGTPSWSWASIDGPLEDFRWEVGRSTQLAEAESYTLELIDDQSPYGQVRSASLTLRCRPLTMYLHRGEVMLTWNDGFDDLDLSDKDPWLVWDDIRDRPEKESEEVTKWLIVPLSHNDYGDVSCLVVRDAGLDRQQVYERVGYLGLSKHRVEKGKVDALVEWVKQNPKPVVLV